MKGVSDPESPTIRVGKEGYEMKTAIETSRGAQLAGRRVIAVLTSLVLMLSVFCMPTFAATRVPAWVKVMRQYQMSINADAEAKKTPTYGSTEQDDINYMGDQDANHTLDVYSPGGVSASKKLPVIVEVHGGGYVSCNKEINRQHGLWFASKGYRVVNINYTLVPEATIKQEIQEINSVFKWVNTNADKYGFDVNNIFLTGDSAGGHLVLLFTAAQTEPELQAYFEIQPAKGYRATAATCPVGSFTSNDLVSRGLTILLGQDFANRNNLTLLSYESFDQPGMSPLFIVTTPTDKTAYTVTKAIHEDMVKKGVSHEYKEYTKQENDLDHVFNVLHPDWTESVQANTDILNFFQAHMSK